MEEEEREEDEEKEEVTEVCTGEKPGTEKVSERASLTEKLKKANTQIQTAVRESKTLAGLKKQNPKKEIVHYKARSDL